MHISSKDVSLKMYDTICEPGLFLHLCTLSKLILPVYWYGQTGSECVQQRSCWEHLAVLHLANLNAIKCICSESALHSLKQLNSHSVSAWVSRKVWAKSVGNSDGWLCEGSGLWCHGIIILPLFSLGAFSPLVVRSWFLYVLRRESNKTLEPHKKCRVFL